MLSFDGRTLLTYNYEILQHWAEHFDNVLNRPSSINEAAAVHFPQADTNMTLAEPIDTNKVKKGPWC